MRIDTPFLPRLSPINFTNLKTSGTTDESLPFNADRPSHNRTYQVLGLRIGESKSMLVI